MSTVQEVSELLNEYLQQLAVEVLNTEKWYWK
jgi:hypothetical protein